MRAYINAIKRLFSRSSQNEENSEESSDSVDYIEEESLSALIEIRLDKKTGNFNILVDAEDMSDESAQTLGLLLYMINTGSLYDFFVEAYAKWAHDDPEKTNFFSKVMINLLASEESFSTNYEKLAVSPEEVFGLYNKEK
jgi:hypothetical protein